ncbi:hypothetical protein ISCGN_019387 [Ixodes scapularis]
MTSAGSAVNRLWFSENAIAIANLRWLKMAAASAEKVLYTQDSVSVRFPGPRGEEAVSGKLEISREPHGFVVSWVPYPPSPAKPQCPDDPDDLWEDLSADSTVTYHPSRKGSAKSLREGTTSPFVNCNNRQSRTYARNEAETFDQTVVRRIEFYQERGGRQFRSWPCRHVAPCWCRHILFFSHFYFFLEACEVSKNILKCPFCFFLFPFFFLCVWLA